VSVFRRWFVRIPREVPRTRESEEVMGLVRRLEEVASQLNRQVDRLALILPQVAAETKMLAEEAEGVDGGAGYGTPEVGRQPGG
jgi:hypothetical protein